MSLNFNEGKEDYLLIISINIRTSQRIREEGIVISRFLMWLSWIKSVHLEELKFSLIFKGLGLLCHIIVATIRKHACDKHFDI